MAKFSVTKEGGGARPLSAIPKASDHLGWAVYQGTNCVNAIRMAEAGYHFEENLAYAILMARSAWRHVCVAKSYKYWRPETF